MDEQTFIDQYYQGDRKAYKANMASDDPEADALYMTYGKRPTMRWHDVETHIRCYPEYEEHALVWIEKCLGYLPQQFAYMPYMGFIQTLIGNSEEGLITSNDFNDEIVFHAKKIRNNDMKRGGWVRHKVYGQGDFNHYDTTLELYKQPARERLCNFLGYEPLLDYSLDAEIYLRQMFQTDHFNSAKPYNHMDFKAATIVMYREIFLIKGETAADESDLAGLTNLLNLYQEA